MVCKLLGSRLPQSLRMKQKVGVGEGRRRWRRPAHLHTRLSFQALCPCCHLAAPSEPPYMQELSTPPRWHFPPPALHQPWTAAFNPPDPHPALGLVTDVPYTQTRKHRQRGCTCE